MSADSLQVLVMGLNYAPEPTGIACYTTGLADGLASRGHDVRVLTGIPHYPQWRVTPGYEAGRESVSDANPHVSHLVHSVPTPPSMRKRVGMELSFGRQLCRQDWGDPDAIVCVSPALISTAAALAKSRTMRNRPPVGVWVQDFYGLGVAETGAASGKAAAAVARLERGVLRAADQVAVIHDRFKAHVVNDLDVDPDRVSVIRNWTHVRSLSQNSRPQARRRFGWSDHEIVALHAGNMGAKQGLENVIEAARLAEANRTPVRFVLLGDGNQRARLEELGAGLQNLEIMDPLPDEDYRAALLAADVLLVNEMASVGEMAVPSKLTSYFTSGNPVVAATRSDSITAAEITTSGGGVVVKPESPIDLLEEVEKLGRDRERARLLGAAGMSFRERTLTRTAALDGFEAWLETLAARRPRRDRVSRPTATRLSA